MNAARTAATTERRRLNEQLIIALGVRHDIDTKRSALDARVAGIRAELARLS